MENNSKYMYTLTNIQEKKAEAQIYTTKPSHFNKLY